jgi:flagellar basal-body rod modification protein FlgD
MSTIAQVVDGQIVETTSTTTSSSSSSSGTDLDKDAFLQLLVAQMKYQDPLEPTSNTEYISQLATFSQLEEMQNLTSSMTLQRASSLVGQYVFMKVTDSSGNTTYPEGQVDYVVYENSKAYLSINETLYSIDDLDTIADTSYLVASRLVTSFTSALDKLPNPDTLTQDDLEDVSSVIATYEGMTDYQKTFLSSDTLSLYNKYADKYQTLAVDPVSSFISSLNEIGTTQVDEENLGATARLINTYNNLSAYQKSLINSDSLTTYNTLAASYEEYNKANVSEE